MSSMRDRAVDCSSRPAGSAEIKNGLARDGVSLRAVVENGKEDAVTA